MKLDTTKINPYDLLTAEELSTISEDAQAKIKYNAVENWILEEKKTDKKHSMWGTLRGWWNSERTPLRIEMVESILKELRDEKKITQKDITKLGDDISDFIKEL
jgi:hypothetical protein